MIKILQGYLRNIVGSPVLYLQILLTDYTFLKGEQGSLFLLFSLTALSFLSVYEVLLSCTYIIEAIYNNGVKMIAFNLSRKQIRIE